MDAGTRRCLVSSRGNLFPSRIALRIKALASGLHVSVHGSSNFFAFGIGSSVNRFLIEGIALALPILNGAASAGAPFVEHARAVLVVPPTLIFLACVVLGVVRAAFRSGRRLTLARVQRIRMRDDFTRDHEPTSTRAAG